MRILRLDLIRFGALTDAGLDFSEATPQRPGFHLIYGPNEAGKSTARHALLCALYGFPARTDYDFLHRQQDLRVGLTMADVAGQSLAFVRRKGNKKTLLDPETNQPISDAPLLRALAGLSEPADFERAFAMGHEILRAGGEAMLDEDNTAAGGALFMAAGLKGVREVEHRFLERAEELFKPRGRNPAINAGLAKLKDLKGQQRQAEAGGEQFRELESALEAARIEQETLQQELTRLGREKSRLTRLRDAKPTLARWRGRCAEREALGQVPTLPPGFSERRVEIQSNLNTLEGELKSLRSQADRDEKALETVVVRDDVLAAAAAIDRLSRSLEKYIQAKADQERLRGEIEKIDRDVRSHLQEIGRNAESQDGCADLVTSPDAARIRALAGERAGHDNQLAQEHANSARLRDRLQGIESDLREIGQEVSLAALDRAVRAAHRAGAIDDSIQEVADELDESKRNAESMLRELSDWSGTADDLRELVLPGDETIEAFRKRFDDVDADARRLADQRSDAQAALDAARHQLATIQQNRDVPSEQALQQARAWREAGWREIRRQLEGQKPGPEHDDFLSAYGAGSLIEAYEMAVRDADTVADRLRREADLVGKIARCQADASHAETKLERLAKEEQEYERTAHRLDDDWRGQWSFLDGPPRSVAEMRAWLTRARAAKERIAQARHLERDCQTLHQRRADLRGDLLAALWDSSDAGVSDQSPLVEVVEVAERKIAECQAANQRRDALMDKHKEFSEDLVQIERRIENLRAEQEAAEAEWSGFMSILHLPEETSHEAAIAVLETLIAIDNARRGLDDKRQRVEQMQRFCREFERDAAELARALNLDSEQKNYEGIVADAGRLLDDARQQAARREHLRRQVEELSAKTGEKRQQVEAARSQLAECCRQAGCEGADALPAIESNAARAAQLDSEIAEFRDDLLDRGGGMSFEEFQRELDETDSDDMTARLNRLEAESTQISLQKDEALKRRLDLERQLSEFGGGSQAAEIAGRIASLKAQIARDVTEYAKCRLAARLLREGRERYRKQSSSGLLERASALFSQLTCGAFTELREDYAERDRPVLLALRSENRGRVEPPGMSDGARDQLYLALRLAWLHTWLDAHQPLPFIADDLLIHFDDQRAAAALEVLSDLSERTQVLFFTHHDHLRGLARDCVPAANLHEHVLVNPFSGDGSVRIGAGNGTPSPAEAVRGV